MKLIILVCRKDIACLDSKIFSYTNLVKKLKLQSLLNNQAKKRVYNFL